jgi:PTH1 family peptidyl-tRNA hydrolase
MKTESADEQLPDSRVMVVGLGNPGPEYAAHRHNAGFLVVDALARAHGLVFARRRRAKAYVVEGMIGNQRILLAKPQTFMNLSGRSVGRLSRAHGIAPESILVVYDDLDLPLGRLRLRPEGGAGGHKGLRSIIEVLGTQVFPRLRVGIDRPPGRMDPADYVLQPFAEEEQACIKQTLERSVAAIECWLSEGIVTAMDQYNRPRAADERECQEGGL